MKKTITFFLLALVGSFKLFAESLPNVYIYQVKLLKASDEALLFQTSFNSEFTVRNSESSDIPYLIKSCLKNGSRTVNSSTAKTFNQGFAYSFLPDKATVKIVETVIDESTYSKPEKRQYNDCINTGEPTERNYKYEINIDVNNTDVQRFNFDHDRIVQVKVIAA